MTPQIGCGARGGFEVYIHYALDGDYSSVSNTQLKSIRAFMDSHEFLFFADMSLSLPGLPKLDFCSVSVDINSFLTRINLDCEHCPVSDCRSLYPLEVLLSMDGKFCVSEALVFIDCEDTRLISGYGKRGHLNHCVMHDLMTCPYYQGGLDVDKSVAFKAADYVPAYLGLKDVLVELFGSGFYRMLDRFFSKNKMFGPLF